MSLRIQPYYTKDEMRIIARRANLSLILNNLPEFTADDFKYLLVEAVKSAHQEIVQFLIPIVNCDAITEAFITAAEYDQLEIFDFIFRNYDVKCNIRKRAILSAAVYAAQEGNTDILNYLHRHTGFQATELASYVSYHPNGVIYDINMLM